MRETSNARFYELMAIAVPDGTPEELIETSQAVATYIENAGGRLIRSSNDSPWGRRRLAYPIRHNSADLRDGFYTLYHFEAEPTSIQELEREIRLNERIIRHLLLMLDSEPIFEEVVEETVEAVDPETGDTVVATETIDVTADRETGEVEIVDAVVAEVDDAEGNVEAVVESVEVVETEEE